MPLTSEGMSGSAPHKGPDLLLSQAISKNGCNITAAEAVYWEYVYIKIYEKQIP